MTVVRKHVQEFIIKFRFNVKRASLVQSRIKMLEKFSELLDFSATREFRPGFVNTYLCILDCAAEQDWAGAGCCGTPASLASSPPLTRLTWSPSCSSLR